MIVVNHFSAINLVNNSKKSQMRRSQQIIKCGKSTLGWSLLVGSRMPVAITVNNADSIALLITVTYTMHIQDKTNRCKDEKRTNITTVIVLKLI